MTRKVSFAVGEFYHVYNRGVEKRVIFNTQPDKHRFSKLLYLCNGSEPFKFDQFKKGEEYFFDRGEPIVDVCGYCLMNNHFHLLLREIKEGGISAFMHRLGLAYSSYFNKLNERKGVLFENNFSARHASDDNYLQYLIAYIHLNPVKMIEAKWKEEGVKDLCKVKDFIGHYRFSSYLDFLDKDRIEKRILNLGALPEYFVGKKEFTDYLNDWLNYDKEDS